MSDEYRNAFPVDGKTFRVPTGAWKAKLLNDPDGDDEIVLYDLEFERMDKKANKRRIELSTGRAGLQIDNTWGDYLVSCVEQWLSDPDAKDGPLECFKSVSQK